MKNTTARSHTRFTLTQLTMLAALATPAAFGMHYHVSNPGTPILVMPTITLQQFNNVSGCSAASNTIAVGYQLYTGGYRMLCADAGDIGFWTTPVPGPLVGNQPDDGDRFLCPSGKALAGVEYIEGLMFPLPLCGELIPDFQTGTVQRAALVSVTNTLVEKLSKTPSTIPGVVSCGPAAFVQSLQASRNAAGALSGFSAVCNTIETRRIIENSNVDLAVRTVGQTAISGRNSSQQFRVDVFNLGVEGVPAGNVLLDVGFDGSAWQLQPFGNTTCYAILAHKGPVDRIVVGERCGIAGNSIPGKGGVIQATYILAPLGSDVTRPATATPQPIVSVKATIINEQLDGADANATNDFAAFPVILQ